MNDNGGNGRLPGIDNDAPSDMERKAAAASKITAELQVIEPIAKIGVSLLINGMTTATRGIDVATTLNSIAWQVGNQLANALEGDAIVLMQLRKGFQESFADGIQKAPIRQKGIITPPGMLKS